MLNNAGLAFDRTYTRHYPMLHDLYTLLGHDTSIAGVHAEAPDGELAQLCRERVRSHQRALGMHAAPMGDWRR